MHSLQAMLEKLALHIRNTIEMPGESSAFEQLGIPNELRRKTFEPVQLRIKIE